MFKNPKLNRISKLYNKIRDEFDIKKGIYITNIYHPRTSQKILSTPVRIIVETYKSNDDIIRFRWKEEENNYSKDSFIIEETANEDIILDSIIRALEVSYREYKMMNKEVIRLLNKVGNTPLNMRILKDIFDRELER